MNKTSNYITDMEVWNKSTCLFISFRNYLSWYRIKAVTAGCVWFAWRTNLLLKWRRWDINVVLPKLEMLKLSACIRNTICNSFRGKFAPSYAVGGRPKKKSAQNREKLTPLVRKMSALAQPLPSLSVRTHHRSFLHHKVRTSHLKNPLPLVRKMSALDKPPDYGRLLWIAPSLKFVSLHQHFVTE